MSLCPSCKTKPTQTDELEDYLELQDPKVRRAIAESNVDIKAGRIKPAEALLPEFKRKRPAKRRQRA